MLRHRCMESDKGVKMNALKLIINACISIMSTPINILGYRISLAIVCIACGLIFLLLKFFYSFFSS